ncbi:YhcN/YlaJ family sporulation lipoprotein [Paenibacillus tengchongensis]|uniref:YhcN/YlaJ family sporulation lipoprotein n=1 Tax=Paenibacillus tengchongensis TaxID=2608684 RepID=UPI00124BE4A9|nr:YhcN/YlaJ family sporulation lipoprotein [Paenibacillus tengchongensis]
MKKSMCLLLVLLLLTSCGIANKESSPSPQDNQTAGEITTRGTGEMRQLTNEGEDQVNTAPQYSEAQEVREVQDNSDLALKDHFEQLAARVTGVQGAHCVVMNNVAVVGIDVDGALDRSRVGTIKYSVAEAIRKDPRGVRTLVTADVDLSSRLADMGRHISQGRPVSGFAAEMADIIGRIVPQLPENIPTK